MADQSLILHFYLLKDNSVGSNSFKTSIVFLICWPLPPHVEYLKIYENTKEARPLSLTIYERLKWMYITFKAPK